MKNIKKIIALALGACMAVSGGIALCACSGNDGGKKQPTEKVLAAPSNFEFDLETGDFSFTANDEKAGYYFVRCYSVTDGVESDQYVASSSRINGGDTGKKSGNVSMADFGWGDYRIKLTTYAASGTDYKAPEQIVRNAQFGVGGTLEKPEFQVTTDGGLAEVVIDWYTINDYYMYQTMPKVDIKFYSDEGLTTVVKQDTVNLHDLIATIDIHPAGGFIWGYNNSAVHKNLSGTAGYANDLYSYDLAAGDYWVTVQAISSAPTAFASSKVSDAVKITVGSGEPTGDTYTEYTSSKWKKVSVLGVPVAMRSDDHSDRVDYAGNQTTTAKFV